MSLELKIEALTAAVIALTARMGSVPAPAAEAAPFWPTVAQAVAQAPAPVAAPAMPAPPTFAAIPAAVAPALVVAAPAAPAVASPSSAPFSDGKGVIDYVMASYKALGPQKGAQIQGVLVGLGYANINEVKPEMYGALYAGVEALKG